MKLLAIVKSKHIGNTMQIAEAMAEVAPLTIADLKDVEHYNLSQYDAVGFGSGIYAGKHDKALLKFVKELDYVPRFSFVFSTAGLAAHEKHNSALVKLLESKGSKVLGSFGCLGLDKFFILRFFGGINKGHPDYDDFDAAQNFICKITEQADKAKNEVSENNKVQS